MNRFLSLLLGFFCSFLFLPMPPGSWDLRCLPGIEPLPLAVKAWSPNLCTARENPWSLLFRQDLHYSLRLGMEKPPFSSGFCGGMMRYMIPKSGFSTQTQNFHISKLGLEKAGKLKIKLPTFIGSQRKQRNSRKTSTSISLTMLKPFTMWITTNCGKFFKRWEYQTTLPVSLETYMQAKR